MALDKHINNKGENLIFIISQPRAGSTLLQRILSSHPDIHTTSEPWIMLHPLYALRQSGIQTEFGSNSANEALTDFLQTLPQGEESYVESIRRMCTFLYENALANTDKKYFLDKTPRYYFIIPELHRVFPKAKYIILLRNPLAVLTSILNTWVYGNRYGVLGLLRCDLLVAPGLLIEGIEYLKNEAHVVHYEELVSNPEQTIERLCNELGLQYYSDMIEYGKNPALNGRMGDSICMHHNRPVKNSIDKWVEGLNSPQTHHFIESYLTALGPDLVTKLGYSYTDLSNIISSKKCPRGTFIVPWHLLMKPNETQTWLDRLKLRTIMVLQRGISCGSSKAGLWKCFQKLIKFCSRLKIWKK